MMGCSQSSPEEASSALQSSTITQPDDDSDLPPLPDETQLPPITAGMPPSGNSPLADPSNYPRLGSSQADSGRADSGSGSLAGLGNVSAPDSQLASNEAVAQQSSPMGSAPGQPDSNPELFPLATTDPTGDSPGTGLKQDLTPEELIEFLAQADKDMQTIASGGSGISDPREARKTLIQIIKMKREASRRLAEDESLSETLQDEGKRGQLQALSHLAALGDLKAADELRDLAETNIQSGNSKLMSDSRLVLIGFAIEDLQNGVDDAPNQIVSLVRDLSRDSANTDVPAMMVMGQARQVLANYGHDNEAKIVRDTIIDLYADSSDAQIAKMASQLAGNVRFDGINQLMNNIHEDKAVSLDQWTESAEKLVDESADLQTVQYLAGSALDLESRELEALATATYDVLEERFTDKESATFSEVQLALEARDARNKAIGTPFEFSLPSINSDGLSMERFRGKIVLMPFWTMDFPQSLQIVPMLRKIQDDYPDDVVIVGMNLDSDASEVQAFAEKNKLDFPHFRAESSAEQSSGNPAAAQFGVVSLPCVVVFDQESKARVIDFSGRKIERTVNELLP
ncbi:AhpC/TSA family protein [Rubripirellula amarantea]|uniref:AhpC/TSA family protein n=2 Tax=Rubripirellula amarantea TaxID=2527999 RepID=A0A5C5WRJ3_9BACT|nr:AhpC/TSA family protein [Rubripirellula amarantea]